VIAFSSPPYRSIAKGDIYGITAADPRVLLGDKDAPV